MNIFKRILTFTAIPLLVLLGSLAVYAADVEQTYSFSQIAMPELLIGVGTRGTAMGSAGSALADDVESLYWNPAGLGHMEKTWLEFSHGSLYQDVSQEFLGLGLPIVKGHTLGLGVNYLPLGSIDKTDITNDGRMIRDLGQLNLSLLGFNLGYGTRLESGLCLGLGGKYFMENLGDQTLSAYAVDAGVQYPFESGLIIALALQNMGGQAGGYALPMEVRAGIGKPLVLGSDQKLNLALDAEIPTAAVSQYQIHLGGEYELFRMLALRAGYSVSDVNSLGSLSGFSAGLGVQVGVFNFGYTFAPMGAMGSTHRISMALNFTTIGENMSSSSTSASGETKRKRKKKAPTSPSSQMSFGMTSGTGIVEKPRRPATIGISSTSEDERMMRSLVQQSLNVETSIRNGNEGNKEVTFTVRRASGPKVAKWMLIITDLADKQVASLSGDGMPETISWNGKNKAGKSVKNIFELSFDLVLVDINNSQESTTGMFEDGGTGGVISSSVAPTASGLSPNAIVSGARGGNQAVALKADKKIGVIYFEQGRAEITNDASEKIGAAVDQMKKYPTAKILVEGYCDPMDEKAEALVLSKNRSDAVTRYLTAYYKISVGRILVRPKGDKQPVVKSEDERLRNKNRRVEITLQAGN